jgi:hypothetical protein
LRAFIVSADSCRAHARTRRDSGLFE